MSLELRSQISALGGKLSFNPAPTWWNPVMSDVNRGGVPPPGGPLLGNPFPGMGVEVERQILWWGRSDNFRVVGLRGLGLGAQTLKPDAIGSAKRQRRASQAIHRTLFVAFAGSWSK